MLTKKTVKKIAFSKLNKNEQRIIGMVLGINGEKKTIVQISKILKKSTKVVDVRLKAAITAYDNAVENNNKTAQKTHKKPAKATVKPAIKPAIKPIVEAVPTPVEPTYELGFYRNNEMVGITLHATEGTKAFLLGRPPAGCTSQKISYAEALKANAEANPMTGVILLMRIMTIS